LADGVWRAEMPHFAKFHQNWSICCGDIAFFKFKNYGLGQYGAKPRYSTLPFWQLCALKG